MSQYPASPKFARHKNNFQKISSKNLSSQKLSSQELVLKASKKKPSVQSSLTVFSSSRLYQLKVLAKDYDIRV